MTAANPAPVVLKLEKVRFEELNQKRTDLSQSLKKKCFQRCKIFEMIDREKPLKIKIVRDERNRVRKWKDRKNKEREMEIEQMEKILNSSALKHTLFILNVQD